ncbi:hypothetical protein [Streptomyces sp. NPDC047097]|uniref:hypothetical protein n=1 Tax=Streptomyces sp. NPDC047097 TaxID=3155260 RepID=UPI0033EA5094
MTAPTAPTTTAPAVPAVSEPPAGRPWQRRIAAALTLLLLATAGVLLFLTTRLADDPALGNRALTDTEATARVAGEVGGGLAEVFSYGPDATERARTAARRLLAGKAAKQYEELFGQVERRAAEQRLTLTTHVVRTGVVRLTADRAELLVFLDQMAQRAGKPTTSAAAQLAVTAELADGRWRITTIQAR